MKFAGVFETTLWLAVGCSLTAYATASFSPTVWVVGIAAVGIARLLTGPTIGGKPAARRVISVLVPGVIFLTLLRSLGAGFSVELFSEFVIMLLAVKTLDRRRCRDAAQIMTLAVFLTIGAVLTSTTMFTGLWVLAFVPVLVVWVLSYQVVRAREAAEAGEGGEPDPRTARDARRLVIVSLLAGGVLTSVVFVILPRDIAGRAFGNLARANGNATTGFSDTVELGSAGLISESSTPVLDLQLRDRDGKVIDGMGQTIYLRGAVLDQYQGAVWQTTFRIGSPKDGGRYEAERPVFLRYSPEERYSGGAWQIEQRITLRNAPREPSPIFAVWAPVRIVFHQSTEAIIPTVSQGVMQRFSPDGPFAYTVRSTGPYTPVLMEPDTPRPARKVTFPSERITELARTVLTEAEIDPDPETRRFADDSRAARAIEGYLRRTYTYTLTPGRPPSDEDPIEWFLFDPAAGAGHCEYFASAMAAMCRSVGIDARVVTGYVAADYNELSQTYLVRQSNAHAWVEALVGPDTWRTFDPTPPGELRRLHQRPITLLTTIEHAIESLEYAWVSHVVGYNATTRRAILGPLASPEWAKAIEHRLDTRLQGRTGRRDVYAAVAAGLVVFLGVVGVGYLITEYGPAWLARLGALLGLRLGRRHPAAAADEPAWLTHAYTRVLRRLAKAGRPKPVGTPLLAHAERLDDPELRAEAERVGRLVYRARFSTNPVADADRAALTPVPG